MFIINPNFILFYTLGPTYVFAKKNYHLSPRLDVNHKVLSCIK